jgi:hypothetical protein
MTTQMQMYPADALHVQVNGSAPLHPQLALQFYPEQWNNYVNCVSPNETTQSSPNLMMMNNYSPSNSLSPFSMQTPSSLPQVSPTNSDPSLSPLYSTSRLGTPTTPGSTLMSSPTIPSPTPSQEHLLQQDGQVYTSDVCHIYLFICFFTEFIIHRLIGLDILIANNFNYSAML